MLLLPGWGMSRASRRAAGFRMAKSSSTISCCWAWRGASRARLVPGRSQSRAATRLTIPASSLMYRDLSSDPAGNAGRGGLLPKGVSGMELRPCAIVRSSNAESSLIDMPSLKILPEARSSRVASGTGLLQASLMAGIELPQACGGRASCTTCRVLVKEGATGLSPHPTGGTGDVGGVGSVGPLPAGLSGQGSGRRGG